MAAYAAVVSLMNIMEQIRDHPRLPTSFDPNQIESLGENLDFFLGFIEGYSDQGTRSKEREDLEMQIASAAHAAEDVIESHVVDQIRAGFAGTSPSFLIDLQKIIEYMSVIKELLAKFKEGQLYKDEQSKDQQPPAAPSRPPISRNTTMVGFDDVLLQLLDRITGYSRGLEIVPIFGLGGIGKTTLARNAYEHVLILERFDCRAWATVSQEMNVRRVLLQLLSCLGQSTGQLVEYPENELGVELSKHLTGRRYLIVLDDMWDISSWDLIKYFCPDNNNSSRVIVTTRLSIVASLLNFSGLKIQLLSEDESWKLLCTTVFGDEDCPPELKEIGEMIVRYCRGLPLTITVIGGLLRTSPRTREYWGYVAGNIGSIPNSYDDNQFQKVLMLSYDALPTYLKPCFLYMGIFPEDHEFRVSRVIKLFVAEGFLKPMVGRTLEDVGESCIQELIDRKLILVSSKGSKGKVKTCKIHDMMRDLCLRLVEKERFISTPQEINSERQFVVHEEHIDPQFFHAMESTLLARSLICRSPAVVSFKSRLLRVLIEVYSDSLDSTFQQVNLRFLAYEKTRAPIGWIPTYELPSSMSQLWNVQTLIIDKKVELVVAPPEIW